MDSFREGGPEELMERMAAEQGPAGVEGRLADRDWGGKAARSRQSKQQVQELGRWESVLCAKGPTRRFIPLLKLKRG